MNKRLITSLAIFCVLLCALTQSAQCADRPNFVFINIDDLGYSDIGPFGSNLNRTPNLDRMAKEGRKLTSCYAAPVNRLLSIAIKPHCLFPWQSATFVSECPAEYFDQAGD